MIKALFVRVLVFCLFLSSFTGCGTFNYNKALDSLPVFDWEGVSPELKKDSYLWTEKYIQSLLSAKLINFDFIEKPYEFIKRGEFVQLLNECMQYPDNTQEHPFQDLEKDDPRNQAITNCYYQGIIDEDAHFYADQYLSRATAAQWLIRAKGGDTLDQEARGIIEPLIFAQDGFKEVPRESRGYLTLCLKPQHQLMYYRWKSKSEFRFIEASMPITKAETAFSLYQLIHPPQEGGALHIIQTAHSINFFPGPDTSLDQQNLQSFVMAPVIGNKDEYQASFPNLIEQIPSIENGLWKIQDDGSMELSFRFRKDLFWSDGKPLTANDAVFWFYLCHHPAYPYKNPEITSMLSRAVAIDPYTVTIFWNQPYPHANYHINVLPKHFFDSLSNKQLSHPFLNDPNYYQPGKEAESSFRSMQYIQDEQLVQLMLNSAYAKEPLHAGPYILQAYDEENSVLSLIPNPHFHAGKALIASISLHLSETSEQLLQDIQENDFDLILNGLSLEKAKALETKKAETHAMIVVPGYSWEHIDLTTDHPHLADKRVRQALLLSIDRELLMQKYFSNLAPVAHSYLPPQHLSQEGISLEKYSFDPIKAGQLLDEAGWIVNQDTQLREKDGSILSITLVSPMEPSIRLEMQEDIAQYWQKQQLKVQIQRLESKVFFEKTLPERKFTDPTAYLYAWDFQTSSNLYTIVHSSMLPSPENQYLGQNYTAFNHSLVDELCMDHFRQIEKTRIMLKLGTIQEILSRELPSLPLYFYPRVLLADKRIEQFKPVSSPDPDTWNIAYWYWTAK
jgi:peptide/nickel transport system substrate-binding protein